ncbi:S-adenosyl-L-homocysteine hydrolase [Erythrobacter litoralis]|uniref:S-adenosyl-L-homocysteine hydrolase n=1 Tax=Erythrobacter litoralis TaxID=39960 RepID=UPI0024350CA6|nr:S-adenosyl-L-homocysteine hydrolase [Erythrobacter litoralis]
MNFKKTLVTMVATSMLLGAPGVVSAGDLSQDEQVRRLDIMLMVTSLRCRMGQDDFQPHYRAFSAAHLDTLNAAARRLEKSMVSRHGAKGAKRALDRISVGMANEYGQGHPWLNCAQLKQITDDLSRNPDANAVTLAAAELLGARPLAESRWAQR